MLNILFDHYKKSKILSINPSKAQKACPRSSPLINEGDKVLAKVGIGFLLVGTEIRAILY
ncbi:MAG: hypothetical protein DRR19_11495 [Candidatus Parabeggiatoa sp. nov. 1]|nr:MAG: hypothetical protein DRR19_11495 [Gammaproteobacteria bacterium]